MEKDYLCPLCLLLDGRYHLYLFGGLFICPNCEREFSYDEIREYAVLLDMTTEGDFYVGA